MKRNDRHDVDKVELILLRVGQHIALETRRKGITSVEKGLLWEAAGTVWSIKKAYRVELAERRRVKAAAFVAKIRANFQSTGAKVE
jgi:hypothetical protein